MTIAIKVTVDIDILEAIEDAARMSPVLMQKAYNRALSRMRTRMLQDLKTKTGSTVYPIRWARSKNPQDAGKRANTRYGYYSRQKAAYYATNGFGKGIPSPSTGALRAGWSIDLNPDVANGAVLEAVNKVPYAVFVQGVWMQNFHIDAGYADAQRVVSDYRVEAENVLIDTWAVVAIPEALGRPK